MWRITAVLASACAALALAGAGSGTTFGVADDAGKYAEDGSAGFFHMLTDLGMTENRNRRLLGSGQTDHDRRPGLPRPVDPARDAARDRGDLRDLPAEDAHARRYTERHPALRAVRRPLSVHPEGHLPQRGEPATVPPASVRRGRNGISGYVQEEARAACYDALKAVDPGITVIAFGLSPRGTTTPTRSATSPTRRFVSCRRWARRIARADARRRSPFSLRRQDHATRKYAAADRRGGPGGGGARPVVQAAEAESGQLPRDRHAPRGDESRPRDHV